MQELEIQEGLGQLSRGWEGLGRAEGRGWVSQLACVLSMSTCGGEGRKRGF